MLPPVLLSLALGLWGVRRGGDMWRDEAVTYDVSHRGLADLWHTLGNADAVHGLYYLFLHGLYSLFGDSELLLVLRLPSVLAMSAAAAGVALIGRRLAGPRAGLFSGVVFALLPSVQRYAQEGRSYALVCAAVVWATYLLVRASEERRPRLWAAYGALMLVACLLHEFAVFALLAHAVAVPRAARRPWACAAAAAVAGLAPLAALSHAQSAQVSWIGVGGGAYAGAARVCLLGVACTALLRFKGRTGVPSATALPRVALSLLVVPTAALMLLSLVKPLYVERYVLYCAAGLALLLGAALDRVARGGRLRIAVVVVATATALAALIPAAARLRSPQSRSDDVTAVAREMRDLGAAGDGVLYLPGWRRLTSLLPGPQAAEGLDDLALGRRPAASHTLYGTEVRASVLRARILGHTRIVAVGDPTGAPADPAGAAAVKRTVLRERFVACESRRVHGAHLTLYARPGHCPA
ncbi:glycosyltransferase family 39 protein [Streptomyces sp. NPDC047525]|uniref:glycosyltransferase family 39 protein n=1 Tax=Streptomyces sp. NPDC047525 TaxID=3155264 RepID=UPI0033D1C651